MFGIEDVIEIRSGELITLTAPPELAVELIRSLKLGNDAGDSMLYTPGNSSAVLPGFNRIRIDFDVRRSFTVYQLMQILEEAHQNIIFIEYDPEIWKNREEREGKEDWEEYRNWESKEKWDGWKREDCREMTSWSWSCLSPEVVALVWRMRELTAWGAAVIVYAPVDALDFLRGYVDRSICVDHVKGGLAVQDSGRDANVKVINGRNRNRSLSDFYG